MEETFSEFANCAAPTIMAITDIRLATSPMRIKMKIENNFHIGIDFKSDIKFSES